MSRQTQERRSSTASRNNDPSTSQVSSQFPPQVRAVVLQLPAKVNWLLGHAFQHPGQGVRSQDLRELARQLDTLWNYVKQDWDESQYDALFDGAINQMLLRLVAAAVRAPPDGREEDAAGTSGRQLPPIGNLPAQLPQTWVVSGGACGIMHVALLTRQATPAQTQFALRLLRTQSLQAASRQMHACIARLPTTPGQLERYGNILNQANNVLHGLAWHAVVLGICGRPEPYVPELVRALRASHVMEHTAQLLLRVVGYDVNNFEIDAKSNVGTFLESYTLMARCALGASEKPTPIIAELAEAVSGPCADHVAMVTGLKTLCAADGGSAYGLAKEVLDRIPEVGVTANENAPWIQTVSDNALRALAMAAVSSARAGRVSMRAAVAVLMRVCRLAVTSARPARAACPLSSAAAGSSSSSGGRGATAAGSGAGGVKNLQRQAGAATAGPSSSGPSTGAVAGTLVPRMLFLPKVGGELGVSMLAVLRELLASRPATWLAVAAEWWPLIVSLCTAREAMAGMLETSTDQVIQLGRLLASPLQEIDTDYLPPAPAPELALALSSGLLPCLERLVRRACEPSGSAEGLILQGLDASLHNANYAQALVPLLAYGEPRQAAALVATVGKALNRVQPQDLVNGSIDKCLSARVASSFLIYYAMSLARTVRAERRGDKPGGSAASSAATPMKAAAARAHVRGNLVSYAVLTWLPALSRLARSVGDIPSLSPSVKQWLQSLCLAGVYWIGPLTAAVECDGDSGAGAADAADHGSHGPAAAAQPSGVAGTAADDSECGAVAAAQAETEAGSSAPCRGGVIAGGSGTTGDSSGSCSSNSSSSGGWQRQLLREIDAVALLTTALPVIDISLACNADALAGACAAVTVTFPEAVKSATTAAAANSRSSWHSVGEATTELPWMSGVLRSLQTALEAGRAWEQTVAVGQLAYIMEAWVGGRTDEAKMACLCEMAKPKLAEYKAMARTLASPDTARSLLRTCSNPVCTSLQGDSELGVKLQGCGGCGAVGYCCRECQAAHWKAGHKAECKGARRGGG